MAHADKRSVSTDALETLGTIIGSGQGRDAIHLAVEPVVAAEDLVPGENVGFIEGGVGRSKNPLGIVDPFLVKGPRKGQHFWLVVYPRQITSLRHVWTHPAFPEETSKLAAITTADSEAWLRNFCATHDCPRYETVMEVIEAGDDGVQLSDPEVYSNSRVEEEYFCFNGLDAHSAIPPEFWDHVEVVLGRQMKHKPSHFTCSC